jgi:hypothetical protein
MWMDVLPYRRTKKEKSCAHAKLGDVVMNYFVSYCQVPTFMMQPWKGLHPKLKSKKETQKFQRFFMTSLQSLLNDFYANL